MKARVAVALTLLAGLCASGVFAWRDGWLGRAVERRGTRPGDEWVLLEREPTPHRVREARERWVLVRPNAGNGEFRVVRATGREFTRWEPLDPPAAARRIGPGGARDGPRLETVRVPAGRFRCARTSRTFTEREGRVMQVDEWWASGVPVPVQRWTRWNAHARGPLRDPPRRPGEQRLGTTWVVLERAPLR